MSDIKRYPIISHLRAEPTTFVLRYRKGELVRSDRGGTFWFRPINTALAEVPVDDREQSFMFTGRSADFQDVAIQGTITYRVVDARLASMRIDFGIDVATGSYREQPLERLAQMITQTAQQLALDWVAHRSLDDVLREAVQELRPIMAAGLTGDPTLAEVGLEVATVRLTRVAPTPELEKALQAPTRERLQQTADEAAFQRRAMAVDKERAIEENELANRIELAKRAANLLAEQGANERRIAENQAEAQRIEAVAAAERTQLRAGAQAAEIAAVQAATNAAEQARIEIYRDLPTQVLVGLAARELAANLGNIDHLNINPDGLAAMMQNLMGAGTKRLEA